MSLACSAAAMDYTGVFTTPPQSVPTSGMPDGPLLGNGDIGVVLAGPPEAQRFYIGKNDFWTRTPANAKVVNVGRLDLDIPSLRGASYRVEQDLDCAEARGTFVKGGLALRTRAWTAATTNLLVIELHSNGAEPLSVSLRAVAGGDGNTPPPSGDVTSTEAKGFTRKADALPGRAREVAVIPRVLGADGPRFVLPPGATVCVVVPILSDLDANPPTPAATAMAAGLSFAGVAALSSGHRVWWTHFWSRSSIDDPRQRNRETVVCGPLRDGFLQPTRQDCPWAVG